MASEDTKVQDPPDSRSRDDEPSTGPPDTSLRNDKAATTLPDTPLRNDEASAGPRESDYPDHLRLAVERHLEGMSFSSEAVTAGLEEAMRYSLLAGGKRIRPVLTLATAEAVGMDPEQAMPLAGAIELIHTYSLIHDDLPPMDDDALRRGQPTCHVAFGEDVAILAGDGLYAEAFKHLLGSGCAPPERLLSAATELASATGVNGMVGGQYVDVANSAPAGPSGLRRLHELKTGRLIGASVICTLLLAGVDGRATMCFRRFVSELGVLFQIVDDILDVTGTDEALGKPSGSDERLGKRTYVSEFGVEKARALAGESHRLASAALSEAMACLPAQDGEGRLLQQITDFIYTRTS